MKSEFKKMASTTVESDGFGMTLFGIDSDVTQEDVDISMEAGLRLFPELIRIAANHLDEFDDPEMADFVKSMSEEMFEEEEPGE